MKRVSCISSIPRIEFTAKDHEHDIHNAWPRNPVYTGSKFNSLLGAFLDSGSNGIFFSDGGIAQCGGNLGTFYCPAKPLALSATLTDANGISGNVNFNVVSASALLNSGSNFALNDLAGSFGSSADLDLGLPFFYGRYVYYGQDQAINGTGKQTPPYVAF